MQVSKNQFRLIQVSSFLKKHIFEAYSINLKHISYFYVIAKVYYWKTLKDTILKEMNIESFD